MVFNPASVAKFRCTNLAASNRLGFWRPKESRRAISGYPTG